MALTLTSLGSTGTATTATSLALTSAAAVAVGEMIVVGVAVDNTGSNASVPTSLAITDSGGNRYSFAFHSISKPTLTVAAGAYCAVYTSVATTALTTSSTITATTQTAAIAMAAYKVAAAAGSFPSVRTSNNAASTTAATTYSHTTPSVNVGEVTLMFGALQAGNATKTFAITGDSDTLNGSWTTLVKNQGNNSATSASDMSIVAQTKIQTTAASTQVWNLTAFTSTTGIASTCVVIVEIANPTGPSLVFENDSISTSITTTTRPLSVPVQTGDLIIVYGMTEDQSHTLTALGDGGVNTYTQRRVSQTATSETPVYLWTATAATTATLTITVTIDGNTLGGLQVEVWRNHGGLGNTAVTTTASTSVRTIALTASAANSAMSMMEADWNATDMSARVGATVNSSVGVEELYYRDAEATRCSTVVRRWMDVGATGSKTLGYTGPAGGTNAMVAAEILKASSGTNWTRTVTDTIGILDPTPTHIHGTGIADTIGVTDTPTPVKPGSPTLTLVSENNSDHTIVTGSTRSLSGIAVQAGDLIVVFGSIESYLRSFTGLTDGGINTYTQQRVLQTTTTCAGYLWTAVAATSTTLTLTVTISAATAMGGLQVEVWRNHGGVGNTTIANTATVALTATNASSAMSVQTSDWTVSSGARTGATVNGSTGTEEFYYRDTGGTHYTTWVRRWDDVGAAGSKTVGTTAPTITATTAAVEILAGTGGGPNNWTRTVSDAIGIVDVQNHIHGDRATDTVGITDTVTPVKSGAPAQNLTMPVLTTAGAGATYNFLGSTVPTSGDIDSGDGAAVSLGIQIVVGSSPRWVTKIRFYKIIAQGNAHDVGIYGDINFGGSSLVQTSSSGEASADGWVEVTLPTPYQLSANGHYRIATFFPQGHYSATSQAYSAGAGYSDTTIGGITVGASASSTGITGQGIYSYGGGAISGPDNSFNSTKYWVDFTFTDTDPAGGGGGVYAPTVTQTTSTTRTINDTVGLLDANRQINGNRVTDLIGITDANRQINGNRVADNVGITDATRQVNRNAVTDTIGLTDARALTQKKALADNLGITDTRALTFKKAPADTIGITDARQQTSVSPIVLAALPVSVAVTPSTLDRIAGGATLPAPVITTTSTLLTPTVTVGPVTVATPLLTTTSLLSPPSSQIWVAPPALVTTSTLFLPTRTGANTQALTPVTVTLVPQALATNVPAPQTAATSPVSVVLTTSTVATTVGPVSTAALPVTVTASAQILSVLGGALSAAALPATVTLVPQTVNRTTGSTSVAATPATVTLAPATVAITVGSITTAVNSAIVTVLPAVVARTTGGTAAVAATPATVTLVPSALDRLAGVGNLAAPVITTAATLLNPTVTTGSVSVSAPLLATTPLTYPPALARAVLAPPLSVPPNLYSPSLGGASTAALSPVTVTLAPVALVSTTGALSATAAPVTVVLTPQTLVRTTGPLATAALPVTVTTSVQPLAYALGGTTVSPPLLSTASTFYTPALAIGALAPPTITTSGALYSPTVILKLQLLPTPTLAVPPTLTPPAITTLGAIGVPTVATSVTVYGPKINQAVTAPLLSTVAVVYPPSSTTLTFVVLPVVGTTTAFLPPVITTIRAITAPLLSAQATVIAPALSGLTFLPVPRMTAPSALYTPVILVAGAVGVYNGTDWVFGKLRVKQKVGVGWDESPQVRPPPV